MYSFSIDKLKNMCSTYPIILFFPPMNWVTKPPSNHPSAAPPAPLLKFSKPDAAQQSKVLPTLVQPHTSPLSSMPLLRCASLPSISPVRPLRFRYNPPHLTLYLRPPTGRPQPLLRQPPALRLAPPPLLL